MSAILELSDISVRRGDRVILGPLNWQVLEGERWVILGPNGAGKTSLTEALCRYLASRVSMAVITNDIYTREDADYLMRCKGRKT